MGFDYRSVPGDYQYRALHSKHRVQAFWHAGKLRMIDQLVRPLVGNQARIVDIGCGSGNLLLEAAEAGSLPVALDLSLEALRFVRGRLLKAMNSPGAPRGFLCANGRVEALPMAGGAFDWVLFSEVIEHLAEPDHAIAEAKRVLRPGGHLLVTTPNYGSAWPVMEWAVDHTNLAPKMAGEQHITRFHAADLHAMLTRADMEILHLGSMFFVSPMLSLISLRVAERVLRAELRRSGRLGMILVAIARRH